MEAILAHGDGDPQALLDKLKSGAASDNTANDEALARQLAQEMQAGRRTSANTTSSRGTTQQPVPVPPAKKGRGTPTELPADFLRIPGQPIPVATPSTSTSTSTMDSDEQLARMLQDELFSQELRNNPEFAHLARGRSRRAPRSVGGMPIGMRSNVGEMPSRASRSSNQHQQHEGPNLLEKISGEWLTVLCVC